MGKVVIGAGCGGGAVEVGHFDGGGAVGTFDWDFFFGRWGGGGGFEGGLGCDVVAVVFCFREAEDDLDVCQYALVSEVMEVYTKIKLSTHMPVNIHQKFLQPTAADIAPEMMGPTIREPLGYSQLVLKYEAGSYQY